MADYNATGMGRPRDGGETTPTERRDEYERGDDKRIERIVPVTEDGAVTEEIPIISPEDLERALKEGRKRRANKDVGNN